MLSPHVIWSPLKAQTCRAAAVLTRSHHNASSSLLRKQPQDAKRKKLILRAPTRRLYEHDEEVTLCNQRKQKLHL